MAARGYVLVYEFQDNYDIIVRDRNGTERIIENVSVIEVPFGTKESADNARISKRVYAVNPIVRGTVVDIDQQLGDGALAPVQAPVVLAVLPGDEAGNGAGHRSVAAGDEDTRGA